MKIAHLVAFASAVLLGSLTQSAQAQTATVYVVTYFEVGPPAAKETAAALRDFTAATRKEDGNQLCDGLAEIDREGRFAMVEAWRDQKALDAHAAAAAAFRKKLQASLIGPLDARPSTGLSVAASAARGEGARAIYVLTHVDVIPSGKDQAIALVKQLAEDSRKDKGALAFDVLQQGNRANHMTLWEGWASRAAFDAHIVTAHTREFRDKLGPLQGALYDERAYHPVR